MKVYKIQTPFNYVQTHCVVAENMGEAERLFLEQYPGTEIIEIVVVSDYVIVATHMEG